MAPPHLLRSVYVVGRVITGLFLRLLKAEFPGSIRVTGGLLGLEASWFCFLVTIAAIVALHFRYREAK